MSDIIIRGMEMPEHGCSHCFLRDGNYCSRMDKDESVVEYARKSERHPDCPLVEFPPHGRLIDQDAILREVIRGDYPNQWIDKNELLRLFRNAPTVIPTSEVKNNG